MTRINGWRRRVWRNVRDAKNREDKVLCIWESPEGEELKYRLANPDDNWKYELKTPDGKIVQRAQTRAEIREGAADWLRVNGKEWRDSQQRATA